MTQCPKIDIFLQTLSVGPLATHEVSQLLMNKPKNRFANIYPCKMTLHIYWREIVNIIIIISDDESRVVLEELPGQTGSDYINASWINVTIDISNKSTLLLFL